MTEARLEWANGEPLQVALFFVDCLNGRALNDEHLMRTSDERWRTGTGGPKPISLLGVELHDELLANGHINVLA